jgi:hypothetical protein
VTIAEGERQHFWLVALADEYFSIPVGISHHVLLRSSGVHQDEAAEHSYDHWIIGPRSKWRERIWPAAAIGRRFDPLDIDSDDTSVVSLQQLWPFVRGVLCSRISSAQYVLQLTACKPSGGSWTNS